jgi:nitrous oxidase accessory protein
MHADGALVRDSTATANVVGVFVMYSKRVRIEGNRLEHASGAAGMGLGFKDSDAVVVEGNRIVGNTTGTYLDNTPRSVRDPVVFRGNAFLGNRAALRLQAPQSGLRFHDNVFLASTALVEVDGGGDAQGVEFLGNYYDDYAGFDLDGDGDGDVAFEVRRVSNDLLESRPELQFFRGSLALSSMGRVAEAVPVLARQTLFSDRRPRTRMPSQLISGSQQP